MPTPQQLLDLVRYVQRALLLHQRLALLVFAAITFATLAGVILMPKSYYSEARLFVRFGRENLALDPTATTGQLISIYESRESEINSLLEVLKSRAMLDRLVDSLSPEFVLYGGEPQPLARRGEAASGFEPAAVLQPSALHQRAVQQLERDINISTPRKSNIITVECRASRPEVAQLIAARLVEIYREEYVRVHRTAGSYQFFADQTLLTQKEWEAASAELGAAKNKLGIVTLDGRKKQLQDEITDIDAKLLTNRSDLSTTQARIASLQELIAKLPATVITQQAQAPNAAFDNMRGTLFQLEAREQELAATRRDDHPQLVAVRDQLRDLRHVLAEQSPQRLQSTEAVNPSRQALELSLLSEQSQSDALEGREQALLAQQAVLRNDLKTLNGKEAQLTRLQQEVELAEARHRSYADKLEQARINRSLDADRISSLTVVQPASFPTRATGPRRAYILGLGLIVAAISSLGSALVAAYLQPMLTTRDELRQVLDLPLVGFIPRTEAAAGRAPAL
ncbi:MAG: hypothetical protein MUF06_06035 [Pirellulaceae bacterium]|jgi:uncharacterized protein involved in exopolysaccharide biosynthesis|nr:hypothetical protein [Pirellulaceae bacterium]